MTALKRDKLRFLRVCHQNRQLIIDRLINMTFTYRYDPDPDLRQAIEDAKLSVQLIDAEIEMVNTLRIH